jgi:hypothetical protein
LLVGVVVATMAVAVVEQARIAQVQHLLTQLFPIR